MTGLASCLCQTSSHVTNRFGYSIETNKMSSPSDVVVSKLFVCGMTLA